MISICIPIYNRDISRLLTDLYRQCEDLDSDYEILLVDDASAPEYQLVNREIVACLNSERIEYEELSENIGRSAIRNMLARKASFPYLLFMDNDTKIASAHFVTRYLRVRNAGVVCYGGFQYEQNPSNTQNLRWVYGVRREAIPADERQKEASRYFTTFNFMIDKRILLLHPFDETVRGYGYEDHLFKVEIVKHGYRITHIDNPLIHEGLISNADFVKQTEVALHNLYRMRQNRSDLLLELVEDTRILGVQQKLSRWKILGLITGGFSAIKKVLLKNLLSNKPSLLAFDLYKLGYLCSLKK